MHNSLETIWQVILESDVTSLSSQVEPWGGAGVIITDHITPEIIRWKNSDSSNVLVHTVYAKELSWLFRELKAAYSDQLDYLSKYVFYPYVARVANKLLKDNPDIALNELLFGILNEME